MVKRLSIFAFLCLSLATTLSAKAGSCDLNVTSNLSFAEFQELLDHAKDVDGDGAIRICLGPGVRITNPPHSTFVGLSIPRNNFEISGDPNARAVIENLGGCEGFAPPCAIYPWSAIAISKAKGFALSNVVIATHAEWNSGILVSSGGEIDALENVQIRIAGNSADGLSLLDGSLHSLNHVSIQTKGDFSFGFLASQAIVGELLDLKIETLGKYASGMNVSPYSRVDRIQQLKIQMKGAWTTALSIAGSAIVERIRDLEIEMAGSGYGFLLSQGGQCSFLEGASINIAGAISQGMSLVGSGSQLGEAHDLKVQFGGELSSGVEVRNGAVLHLLENFEIANVGNSANSVGLRVGFPYEPLAKIEFLLNGKIFAGVGACMSVSAGYGSIDFMQNVGCLP